MDLSLKGKSALVLGSTKGIGYGIAKVLLDQGARVGIVGRDRSNAEKVAENLSDDAAGFGCDTSKAEQINNLYGDFYSKFGSPNILVLNGGGPPPGKAQGISSEQWRNSFEGMFVNLVRLADLAIPKMIEAQYGRIISIISSGVIEPIPNLAISNTIRPALVGWCKTLANEIGAHGITVNCVAPGRIATDRLKELDANNAKRSGRTVEDVQIASQGRIPVGRYGTTEEFASPGAFLASEEASFITGSVIRVDGGQITSTI